MVTTAGGKDFEILLWDKKSCLQTKDESTVYYHFAQIPNEGKSAAGVGRPPYTAKEDAARRLLLLLLLNFHRQICTHLAWELDF